MQLRVIDLGKCGGKIVRRFPMDIKPAYAQTPGTLFHALNAKAISPKEVEGHLAEMGYSPNQIVVWFLLRNWVNSEYGKEVTNGRFD